MMDRKLNILQVGSRDLIGQRFNGQDLINYYREQGHDVNHLVYWKQGDDPDTHTLYKTKFGKKLNYIFFLIERFFSLQSLLPLGSLRLLFRKEFWKADVVHYHLIHDGFFSFLLLPLLTRLKPSVWTIHDPWAMTGHCVYPLDCERWLSGCGSCPRTDIYISMKKDRSALMWKLKKWIYRWSKFQIIVASSLMEDMVKKSPLMKHFPVHKIAFGLDLDKFSPSDQTQAKQRLNIPEEYLVLGLRAAPDWVKGVDEIKGVLDQLSVDQPIAILTTHYYDVFADYMDRFMVIDLGWVEDEQVQSDYFNACDIFLMPSIAEAFGMMAMEAMACGKPVIVFEGTALPEVIQAPIGGSAVPMKDVNALHDELVDLILNEEKRSDISKNAREIAIERYDFIHHAEKVKEVYLQALEKNQGRGSHAVAE